MIELTEKELTQMATAWVDHCGARLQRYQGAANALETILTARGLMIVPMEALGPVTDEEWPLAVGNAVYKGDVNGLLRRRRAKYAPQPVDEAVEDIFGSEYLGTRGDGNVTKMRLTRSSVECIVKRVDEIRSRK